MAPDLRLRAKVKLVFGMTAALLCSSVGKNECVCQVLEALIEAERNRRATNIIDTRAQALSGAGAEMLRRIG